MCHLVAIGVGQVADVNDEVQRLVSVNGRQRFAKIRIQRGKEKARKGKKINDRAGEQATEQVN